MAALLSLILDCFAEKKQQKTPSRFFPFPFPFPLRPFLFPSPFTW